ncbi:trk system potassium uptake protein TrkH [Poseidonocella pacifica]|uniref:Trk system potassium uptake protein TrkH n=1 Tax=Poseidonocella pacifica TaxID=871651 RepID=A0A1I0YC97_9RHOB|nr:potassium transporter TrkG [Poseidonocella pacifica]SFB11015.1 trk system potassium uptake protein TrkH [Poseidonocella pacifica]
MASTAQFSSVRWRARPGKVVWTLLGHGNVLLAILLPPLAAALIEREWRLALMFLPGILLCLLGVLLTYRRPAPSDLRSIEASVTFALLFLIASILPLPVFVSLGLGPVDALFESVSGITSTGLSVVPDLESWPISAHFLRAWTQWIGGFAIALAGVALILGPGPAAHVMGETTFGQRDLLQSTRAQARSLLRIYCAITVIGVLLLWPLLPSWWEAVCVTLAAVSTGGFAPRNESLAAYSLGAQVLTLLLCLSTTVSFGFYGLARSKGALRSLRKTNAAAVVLTALIGVLATLLLAVATGARDIDELAAESLTFLSAFTTAGFSIGPIEGSPALTALLLAAMVVGGGIGSTAGGIKLDRALTLLKMVRLEFNRLRIPPSAVTSLMEQGRRVAAERIVSVAAITTCYAVSALVFWIIFLASGEPALPALFDVTSALSTVGLSAGVTGPDLAPHLKGALILAMLLGRLEFLALIAALSPLTWTSGR